MASSSVCDGPPPSDSTPSRPLGRRGSCGSDCFAGFLRVAWGMHPEEESRPSWSRHQGCERTTVPERRADAFDRLSRHPSGSNSACTGIIASGRLSTRPTSRMQIISGEHLSGGRAGGWPTHLRVPRPCRPCSLPISGHAARPRKGRTRRRVLPPTRLRAGPRRPAQTLPARSTVFVTGGDEVLIASPAFHVAAARLVQYSRERIFRSNEQVRLASGSVGCLMNREEHCWPADGPAVAPDANFRRSEDVDVQNS